MTSSLPDHYLSVGLLLKFSLEDTVFSGCISTISEAAPRGDKSGVL